MENQKLLIQLAFAVIAVWLASVAVLTWFLPTWGERGTFGDSFGAVNALFSGFAFAGLIYTIVLQRKEIEANREEIRKTNRSQRHAQKVMDAQLIQMKQTTQLHALNLLMDYFNRQIADPSSSPEKVALAREKRRETIAEIDKMIDRFNDDELDSMS